MARKTTKEPVTEAWDFYLANGEWFAKLTFSRADIKKFFRGAKIRKGAVYL